MTRVPLRDKALVLAFLGIMLVGGFASWIWASVHAQIAVNTHRIDVIEELYQRSSDRWTGADQRQWCEELKRLNPDLKLPAIPIK